MFFVVPTPSWLLGPPVNVAAVLLACTFVFAELMLVVSILHVEIIRQKHGILSLTDKTSPAGLKIILHFYLYIQFWLN